MLKSSYWTVPDSDQYLSSLATHKNQPLIAVASGSDDSNLFVYEIHDRILTHHQTISLGGIHSLAWADPNTALASQGNVLCTGHNDGYVHLVLLPDLHSTVPAEIIKRFNHNRHTSGGYSRRIKHLALTPSDWRCCRESSIMTLFDGHIFLWDPTRSDIPVMKRRFKGDCFDMSSKNGVIALGSSRGISIKDIRTNTKGLSPPVGNDGSVSMVTWNAYDDNLVAAVHDNTVIKVWDIRSSGPITEFNGHSDNITGLQWTPNRETVSSSSDGTIRIWDIDAETSAPSNVGLPSPSPSPPPTLPSTASFKNEANDLNWIPTKNWKLYRQRLSRYDTPDSWEYFIDPQNACTKAVFSNRQFLSVDTIGKDKIVSIDSDGYFGYHYVESVAPSSPISTGSL